MLRVCSWCDKSMGWKPGSGSVTSGICLSCYEVEISKIKSKPNGTLADGRYAVSAEAAVDGKET